MRFLLVLLGLSVFSTESMAMIRFEKDQLKFDLLESNGQGVSCWHEPLKNQSPAPPPPWWKVTCGDRSYVVDVWMDHKKKSDGSAIQLMFHAKESTSSSGEKRTRFDTHLTELEFANRDWPRRISSSIDVRNGLADLQVRIALDE